MASPVPLQKMKRSKSLNSLVESRYRCESECDKSYAGDDSGVQVDGFVSLERKVDKLSDICIEQTRVLAELTAQVQEQVRGRGAGDRELATAADLLHDLVEDRGQSGESGARSLLDAIEARPSLERRLGDALADLLQSEDLKQRIVSATSASIKEQIKSLFSLEVSSLYVPIMERAHRQLMNHVTKMVAAAFADLEENTTCNVEVLRQTSLSLQAALQKHESLLLQACDGSSKLVDAIAITTEKVIERKLKQWREEMSNAMPPVSECESIRVDSPGLQSCASPEVLVNTELTPVDRMMITAEVMKLIQEGDVNGAFTRALLAADLAVVVAACRAAPPPGASPPPVRPPGAAPPPGATWSPARPPGAAPPPGPAPALAQPVLLSLLQQLATDLLLDTPLKCSYIEYALLNLNPADAVTRAHLPFVIEELHRHLSAFLQKYPHHTQAHRIFAIIDTARSLL